MKYPRNALSLALAAALAATAPALAADQPAGSSVAEIQAAHDRALIRDLSEYVRAHPKADDRDQAYSSLFNKAIEHDWFSEAEPTALEYLKNDPDGPVKPLAQIVNSMARAQAGRFEEALAGY